MTVGTQTGTNLSNPFATGNHDSRYQYILTSAELSAAGLTSSLMMTSIGYNVTLAQALTMNGLTISMKHTAATTLATFDGAGFTQVYTGNFATTSTGWRDLTFQNNFIWDGTSNLLIQVCFDNTTASTNSQVTFRGTGSNRAVYQQLNNTVGCSLATATTSQNVPITRFYTTPAIPILSNYSANATLSTSFAHRRGASIAPKFTIQSPVSFNAVQFELNQAANFSGVALVSTITTGGPFSANTPYDFWTTQNLTGDRTYFVRVRVSSNGGATYGPWSNQLWPYSYYPATTYPEEGWYYTTQEQFQTGVVQETLYNFLSVENNATAYPDDDYIQVNEGNVSINATANDGVYENGTFYPSENYMTIGWQNDCNGNAAIYNGFPFMTNIPQAAIINSADFSAVSTTACICETQTVSMRLIFDAHNVDNGPAFSGANLTSLVTPARTTAKQTFLYNAAWVNNTRYTLTSVTNVLQEIINRPGWTVGNRFNLMGRWDSGYSPGTDNNRCIRQADNGAATAPRIDATFTNFKNTVRFPNVDRAIYGPDATAWEELRITDNTVGCGTCYTEYRIHDAGTNAVIAGPFTRTAGNSGSQYFDISSAGSQLIYVTASMFRNNNTSPQIQDVWLTTTTPSPLPVELGSFEGKCDNGAIQLDWSSISEKNVDYYTVESSAGNGTWTALEKVKAQGTTTSETTYQSSFRAQNGSDYYRLKWTDFDGKEKYSSIIYVSCKNHGVSIFPNPNNGTFVISGANIGDQYEISSTHGQLVSKGEISSSNTMVQLSGIASGTYMIKVQGTNSTLYFKMILE